MPYFAGPVADERDALLTFLAVPRAALRAAVFGLTDEQARSRPAASALCLGGLVKHAARTERRWVVAGIAGQPLPGLWPIEDWPADFQLTGEESLDGVLFTTPRQRSSPRGSSRPSVTSGSRRQSTRSSRSAGCSST